MAFTQLTRCSSCRAFLGLASVTCPSCGHRSAVRALGLGLAGLAASASVSVTLMACYGCPPGSGGCTEYPTSDGGRSNASPEVDDSPPVGAASRDAGDAGDASDAGDGEDAGDAASDGGTDAGIDGSPG